MLYVQGCGQSGGRKDTSGMKKKKAVMDYPYVVVRQQCRAITECYYYNQRVRLARLRVSFAFKLMIPFIAWQPDRYSWGATTQEWLISPHLQLGLGRYFMFSKFGIINVYNENTGHVAPSGLAQCCRNVSRQFPSCFCWNIRPALV